MLQAMLEVANAAYLQADLQALGVKGNSRHVRPLGVIRKALPVVNGAPAPAGFTFDELLQGWTRDHGFDLSARRMARAAYDRRRTIERLAEFLGHRDALRLMKADLTVTSGVAVLRITDEGDADDDAVRSLKTRTAAATFPDAKPDKLFGLRSINAGKRVSRWLRVDLGIVDPRVSPNHSWRHFFVTACRAADMNREVRSALTEHSAKLDESDDYGEGVQSFIAKLASTIAKVHAPTSVLRD